MTNAHFKEKVKDYWHSNKVKILFTFLLAFLFSNGLFIARNLVTGTGIIPDEERTFIISKQFSTTWGVPNDTPENLKLNQVIKQNPNLYFWINGRIINITKWIFPSFSDSQLLISLRVTNLFYAVGTVIFCYLFSKELIENKWWQLMPVFMLISTNSFVFLSGGVNDDNLTHLVCSAAIYFLTRILNNRSFTVNSLAMLISLASCTLIKHRVLPFVFAVGVVWIIYIIKNYKNIIPIKLKGGKIILLSIIFLCFFIDNLAIYGYNLVVFRSVLPSCQDVLTIEQCNLRRFYFEDLGPEYQLTWKNNFNRLSISESKELGYPGPIEYFIMNWIPYMLTRTFAVFGTNVQFSIYTMFAHHILFFMMILFTFSCWRDYSFKIISLLGIVLFYSLTLFIYCYRYETQISFNYEIIQGRYLFSVINIAFVFAVKVTRTIPKKSIRLSVLGLFIIFYFLSGPLTFIQLYISPFSNIIFN